MLVNELKWGAALSYISLIIGNVIGLLYTPYMLRSLGQAEYGLYSLIASVVAYLTVLDFGFGNAIIRYTAKYRALKKENELSNLLGMFFLLYILIGLIAFAVGMVLYYHMEYLFHSSMTASEIAKAKIMMLLLVINITITFPMSIFGAVITAYEKFVFQNILNIIRILLNPILMIPLLFLGYKSIAMVVVVSFINIVVLSLNCLYYYRYIKVSMKFRYFDRNLMKEISLYSFYVFLGLIVGKIYWSAGQFVLGVVAGTLVVATYAIAIQLQTYFMSFSTAITSVFLPRITTMVSRHCSDREISDLFLKVGRLQFIIVSYVLCAFILCGKEFIIFWAGSNYEEAFSISLIIMIPLSFSLIQNLGITILQARNQQKFRSVVNVIVAFVGLSLSYYLSKEYGGIGCAIGTSFALMVGNVFIINIYYHKKIGINIPQFWKQILFMLIPVIGTLLFCLFTKSYIKDGSNIQVVYLLLLYTLLFALSLWAFVLNSYEKELIAGVLNKLLIKNKTQ